MADLLNLDARRAEVLHTPKKVQLDGATYELPPELPLVFGEYLAAGQFRAGLALLFGDTAAEVVAPLLSMDDLVAICSELYGISVPESSASSSS